jgi:hypothetical protein
MKGDLMISCHQVNFGKDGAARKVMGVILDVADGTTFGDTACVEGSVISTRPPTAVLFGYELKSR